MEVAGLVEVMSMAEGALFRFARTGNYYEPPCLAVGALSIMDKSMRFRINITERDGEEIAEVDISQLWEALDAPSWKLWVCKDGRWNVAVYGGRTMSDSEWEIDGDIENAVQRRNAVLE